MSPTSGHGGGNGPGRSASQRLVVPEATEWSGRQQWRCARCPPSGPGLPRVAGVAELAQALWEALASWSMPVVMGLQYVQLQQRYQRLHDCQYDGEVIDVVLLWFEKRYHLSRWQLHQLKITTTICKNQQLIWKFLEYFGESFSLQHIIYEYFRIQLIQQLKGMLNMFWLNIFELLRYVLIFYLASC